MAKALKKKPILEGEVIDRPGEHLRVVEGGTPSKHDSFENEFKLKSEFFEKNVRLPNLKESDDEGPITQVKVYRDTGVDIINPQELKSFVRENKDIKQVVVEKISIDEATRVSLLFEPKHQSSDFVSLVEDQIEKLEGKGRKEELSQELDEDEKVFNLDELENLINHEFMKVPAFEKKKEQGAGSRSNATATAKIESEKEESNSRLSFGWPKKSDDSNHSEETQHHDEQENIVENSGNEKLNFGAAGSSGAKGRSFRLKSDEAKNEDFFEEQENSKRTSGSVESPRMNLKLKQSDESSSDKKVNYEKHTFTRKKNRSGHGYYYRAKDHVELFKVGSSFLKDFRSGLKSFSFSSIGLKEEREKSVLGILSFFNYHEDVNVCVITPSLQDSYYARIATKAKKREAQVFDEDLHYEFYTGDGFEVIEYSEFKRIERKISAYNFEDFLDFILDSFDIVLWDLPEIEVLDSNKEVYFPIIRSLDNVSFIVGKNVSKISDINEMISYFKRYQIPIKGLLFSGSDSNKDRGGKK